MCKIGIDILTSFLEYSRIQDSRKKHLAVKFMLNVSTIVTKIVTLFCII